MADTNNKCRACLIQNQNSNNMVSMNENHFICNKIMNLSELFTICTNIEVAVDDTFPKCLCTECIRIIDVIYNFRLKCEESDKILRSKSFIETIFHTCDKCSEIFASEEDLLKHLVFHENLTCQECNLEFQQKIDFENHLLFHNIKNHNQNLSENVSNQTSSLRATRRSKNKENQKIKLENHTENFCFDTKTNSEKSKNFEVEPEKNTESLKTTNKIFENDDLNSDYENLQEENFHTQIKSESDLDSEHSETETKNKNDKLNISKIKTNSEKNGIFECICCDKNFESQNELRVHLRLHKNYQCKVCRKNFTILSNLRRHLRGHLSLEIKNERVDENVYENPFKCISCPKTFSKRKLLSLHLKTHDIFTCTKCPAKFTFATNLRKHLQKHTLPKDHINVYKPVAVEKRTCDLCLKVFKYRLSMLKHRKKHNETSKKCQFCFDSANFDTPIQLYKHMERFHENEKKIICNLCGKRFFKELNLKLHMNVHSGNKPYMCEFCGASFALAGNLATHKRLHTGQKPYKCQICNRGFTQQATLRSHEASHSGIKSYTCPDCGASFSRPGALKNHRKRHENARPFKCSVCEKCFTFSYEVKRHMLIHSGKKDYVCDFCGKGFTRSSNLAVHRKIHTGELPYKCQTCGKGFIQAHCLRKHLGTHQKIMEQAGIIQNGLTIM